MSRRLPGHRNRRLSALAIALSTVLLAVVAATLDASVSTTAVPDPPKSAPTSSVSLLALLYLLLDAFLSLFGLSLDPPSGQFSGGSLVGLAVSMLRSLYQYRLAIVTAVVLLTVLGLLYQYRHQLAVPRVLRSSGETAEPAAGSSSSAASRADWPPEPAPESVQEAWVAMIRRVDDGEKPASRTPTEWQRIAIDAGLPADAVDTITTTFRTVRYGPASETETHLERVHAALDRLDTRREAADE